MTDGELLARFEALALTPAELTHREHVRLAFSVLAQERELAPAAIRFRTMLRRFADANGAGAKYHETITWAYLFLIHERMRDGETWDGFAERNADLLVWRPSILDRYYRPETIASDRARHRFILPDAVYEDFR